MKINKFLLIGALAAISAAFTACSDDDDNNADDAASAVAYDSHAVDLGLPSGVKWSDQNLGADAPEEYGNYYGWGSIEPLSTFNSETYYATVDVESIPQNGFAGNTAYDAAAYSIGGKWRIATAADWAELRSNSTTEWTTSNGVSGLKITGPNGNSIFIPASGYYSSNTLAKNGFSGYFWTDAWDPGYVGAGISMVINAGGIGGGGNPGHLGYSIRPVRD